DRARRAMRPNPMANYKVADLKLADAGRLRVDWAETRMPVLMALREKGKQDKPLRGMRIAGSLHVTKETAVLVRTLVAAGAEISWSGCNPLSTNDEVAAALAADGHSVYAWHGLSVDEFYWCIERTLDFKPTLTLDDGADLIATEIKPTQALKALLEGHRVMPMDEAAKHGDLFITATGIKDVLVGRHFDVMKDGAVVCNTGHYDCEINLKDLEARSKGRRTVRPNCEEYTLKD